MQKKSVKKTLKTKLIQKSLLTRFLNQNWCEILQQPVKAVSFK